MLIPPMLPSPANPLDRIAFAGPMCSGKTTLADILVEDYNYVKLNFARKLKLVAEELYGPISKNNEGRKLLQEFADDLKKWDANLFTTHLLLDVEHYINVSSNQQKVVIDDLRFPQEYRALKENGFIVIGVLCEQDERLKRVYRLYPDTDPERFKHSSEVGWMEMSMDYFIDNTTLAGQVYLKEIMG